MNMNNKNILHSEESQNPEEDYDVEEYDDENIYYPK